MPLIVMLDLSANIDILTEDGLDVEASHVHPVFPSFPIYAPYPSFQPSCTRVLLSPDTMPPSRELLVRHQRRNTISLSPRLYP